jgi:O-antigen ligase
MSLSPSDIVQLSAVLILATGLFFVAYRLPQIVGSTALLVMIPVQPVDTRYGTANVLLTFVIFLAMLLRRGEVRLPLLPQILFLLFCYFLSMSFVHNALYMQHAVYMLSVVSAIMVFWIAYDLTYRYRNLRGIVTVFLAINLVVVIYCAIQLYVGPGQKVSLFGIHEMTTIPSRWDNRLSGPFLATGVTSEFFVIMVFVILHQLLFAKSTWLRRGLMALAAIDLSFLIATGNRGGFLTLLGGSFIFLWLFRKELGTQRVVKLAVSGVLMLSFASAIVVNYTDFNRLFARLGDTTFAEGIPDTRQNAWPKAWAKIKERPILGHGPRYQMDGAMHGVRHEGSEFQNYPHNLYLFLLATVGLVGLIAFMNFILTPLFRCWRTMSLSGISLEYSAFMKTGVVIMIVLLVDQLKIEFMRIALVDYWHFIFAIFGVLIAVSDQARSSVLLAGQQVTNNRTV